MTTKRVILGKSSFGNLLPHVLLEFPAGTSERVVRAELHEFAAKVERETPEEELWCIVIEQYYDASGRVCLELVHATPREAERAMSLLHQLVG